MRNPNGYGAIFKLTGKRRKPWAVVKTISINTGKQKRILLGTFEKRNEAIAFLTEYNKNPYDLKTKNLSFLDVYKSFYDYQTKKVTDGTLINYRTCIKFFEPIYKLPIRDLKLYEFQKIFDDSSLSYSSLANRKALATSVYDYAIRREIIDKNTASNIEINKENEAVRVRTIFTEDEIKKMWEYYGTMEDDKQTIGCILIMLYTSLRIGELLNLRKEDIDMSSSIKTINVIKSKTKAGIRLIPLHDKIIPIVQDLLKNQSNYLIGSPRNKLFAYAYWVAYRFNPFMTKIDMYHRAHDCRHTFITRMTAMQSDRIALRQIIGHEGKDITEKVYTHLPIEILKKNIDLLT